MKKAFRLLIPFLLFAIIPVISHAQVFPSQQYGQLFHKVEMSKIFKDSKTFTDMIALHPPKEIMKRYNAEKDQPNFNLKKFVFNNFKLPATKQTHFKSHKRSSLVKHINRLWPVLTRSPDSIHQLSSLIPLPYPYVVPGGRFREIYYWDSYFTILGLWHSHQISLIEDMVNNFAYLINSYGFIPNGNRTYYLTRSQPPFFPLMVEVLAKAKHNPHILVKYLPEMQKEYDFWMKGSGSLVHPFTAERNVVRLDGEVYLNRYWDSSDRPRPESFREDSLLARHSKRNPTDLYRNLRAAAESGWDFSSRWLADKKSLSSIVTTQIVPADLNSLLYHYEKTLSKAYKMKGDSNKAAEYEKKAEKRKIGIQKYCWDPQLHTFTDYNFKKEKSTGVISAACLYPLFFHIANDAEAKQTAHIVRLSLLKDGGIVTTTNFTGQQWDKPNGWAPLQWIAYKGLMNYGFKSLAREIRKRWMNVNQRVFHKTGKMMEKYNVVDPYVKAGGGEYALQDGFGWTNGVYMQFEATKE